MSPETWDTHYWRIYRYVVDDDGLTGVAAAEAADRETTEQFGERPQEETG